MFLEVDKSLTMIVKLSHFVQKDVSLQFHYKTITYHFSETCRDWREGNSTHQCLKTCVWNTCWAFLFSYSQVSCHLNMPQHQSISMYSTRSAPHSPGVLGFVKHHIHLSSPLPSALNVWWITGVMIGTRILVSLSWFCVCVYRSISLCISIHMFCL